MPEGEEEEQKIENLFEQIMKEIPNLAKEIGFQEAQRVPKKLDSRRTTPRHIIITLPGIKDKERILKAARVMETVTYKGMPIRVSAMGTKSIKVMKGKDLHPRLLYPAKLSFRMEGQIKFFSDKVKLKDFITTKPFFYEMLKGFI